uniref:uncharacterized protein LOC120347384 n=1 Tax=Styela clava TaxID=7725 RepID=UPI0019394A86|nr:uncharacterized protein LOC120347384 [Styela clava]
MSYVIVIYMMTSILSMTSTSLNTVKTAWTSVTSLNETTGFQCSDGRRINIEKVCNGVDDCVDGFMTDECDCDHITDIVRPFCAKLRIFHHVFPGRFTDTISGSGDDDDVLDCILFGQLVNCTENPGSLRCTSGELCVTRPSFCDDDGCCPGESDELHAGFGLKCPIEGAGHSNLCVLPSFYIYDDEDQCVNGRKNCYERHENGSLTENLKKSCFECLNREHVILSEQVCDGVIDCSDFSDECLCENIQVGDLCTLIYNATVDRDKICEYSSGDVSCGDGTCISRSKVCDGRTDCANRLDENHCYTMKYRKKFNEKLEEKDEIDCIVTELEENEVELEEAVVCDGIPECDDLQDECHFSCGSKGQPFPAYCSANLDCIPGSLVCNGKKESQLLETCNFTYIPAEEENCPERFYCEYGNRISIDIALVCDGVVNCEDETDEAKERNCNDGRFYCETNETASFFGKNRQRQNHVFVRKDQVGNGRYDCDDGSDECPTRKDESNAFSSRTEMISWAPLRWILWINAILALAGNAIVILFTINLLRKKYHKLTTVARCHHIMVLNLSLADLLMGIYLLVLAIKSIQFSGRYCPEDKPWRMSKACTTLGAMSLISSEMSVMTMLIMAVFRFFTIIDPLNTIKSSKTEKIVRFSIALGWIISILFAVLPAIELLELNFITHAWTDNPLFGNDVITSDVIIHTTERVLTSLSRGYGSNTTTLLPKNVRTTGDIQEILRKSFPQKKVLGWFGFYGQNSVCLPRLFANTSEQGWQYSIIILCFNLSSFFIMVLLYGFMVKTSRSGIRKLKETNAGELPKCHLMERVTRLLVTDFLCWFPICVIAFIYLAGVKLDVVVYAISGIVLLPINSALNPILYSGIFELLGKKANVALSRMPNSRKTDTTRLKSTQQTKQGETSRNTFKTTPLDSNYNSVK